MGRGPNPNGYLIACTELPMRFILLIALAASCRTQALWAQTPGSPDPGGVLNQLTVASFGGSGQSSIQAIATDASGNVYVAGTTTSRRSRPERSKPTLSSLAKNSERRING